MRSSRISRSENSVSEFFAKFKWCLILLISGSSQQPLDSFQIEIDSIDFAGSYKKPYNWYMNFSVEFLQTEELNGTDFADCNPVSSIEIDYKELQLLAIHM